MPNGAPPMSPEGGIGSSHIGVGEATKRLEAAAQQTPKEDPIQAAARRAAVQVQANEAAQGAEAALSDLSIKPPATPSELSPAEISRLQVHKGRFPGGIDQTETSVEAPATAATAGGGSKPPEAPPVVGTQPNGEQPSQQPAPDQGRPQAPNSERPAVSATPQRESQNDNTDAQLEASLDAAARQQVAAKNRRVKEFQSWSPDQLADEISVWERRENMAMGMMQRGTPPETQRLGQEQLRNAQARLDELRSAQREGTTGSKKNDQGETEIDKARRQLEENLEYEERLGEMNATQLGLESNKLKTRLASLQGRLRGPLSATDRQVINEQRRDTQARIDAVKKANELREPAETEEQAKKAAEEERQELDEIQMQRAENPTPEDVTNFENAITGIRTEVSDLEKSLGRETDPVLKKQVRADLIEARKRLKSYESAYKTAQDKLKEPEGSDTPLGEETIGKMSPAEYAKLSNEQKVARLKEIAGVMSDLTPEEWNELLGKVRNGEKLSQNEMGQFVKLTSGELVRGNTDVLDAVYKLNGMYSEIVPAVLSKVAETKAGNKALREAFPTNWDKVLKLAGKNKGLLMLLLAILGAAAGALTAGVGPALALGGAGAAGVGASSGFRK